jgi:hypothetical protein
MKEKKGPKKKGTVPFYYFQAFLGFFEKGTVPFFDGLVR